MTDVASVLAAFVAQAIPGSRDVRIALSGDTAKAGFSAETTLFDALWQDQNGVTGTVPMVLRRQIVGHDLVPDADLARQARMMTALRKHSDLPVPRLIGLEPDADRLGAPFLVMERLPGRIVPQNPNYNVEGWLADLPQVKRARAWLNGVEAMARLHRLNWRDGFTFLDRKDQGAPGLPQYVAWVGDWLHWALAGRSHPVAEATLAWLRRTMPADAPVSVVWGDAIPANQLFDDDLQVTGLIDWEFAALGPGEVDLAWWLYFDELFSEGFHVPRLAGLPDRKTVVTTYESALGRRTADMHYYLALTGLRMAIVSIRAVDRLVGQKRFKQDNDAWISNPSSAWLARHLGMAPVTVGPDFGAFTATLFGKR